MSIAHKILKLKGKGDLPRMQKEARQLYEKLTILLFTEQYLESPSVLTEEKEDVQQTIDEVFERRSNDVYVKHNIKEYNEAEGSREQIIVPVMDTIRDLVAEMPQKEDTLEELLADILPEPTFVKRDAETVSPVVEKTETAKDSKQLSLNDKLNKSLQIDLNDRLAFVKQLFNGSTEDFNRAISQINTLRSAKEASQFINDHVKPEYDNWQGKEKYEERFMEIVERRFA